MKNREKRTTTTCPACLFQPCYFHILFIFTRIGRHNQARVRTPLLTTGKASNKDTSLELFGVSVADPRSTSGDCEQIFLECCTRSRRLDLRAL